jgi:hypothetical protein
MSTDTLALSAAASTKVVSGDVPVFTEPLEGMPVDASYATFTWTSVADADGYTFQVARDEAFTHLVVDVSVGDATMLTLFEAFRPDGEARYARVAAIRGDRELPYSAVVAFHPLSDDEYEQRTIVTKRRPDARTRPTSASPVQTTSSDAEVVIYRTAGTSDAMALAVVAAGLGMLAMLIAIVLFA